MQSRVRPKKYQNICLYTKYFFIGKKLFQIFSRDLQCDELHEKDSDKKIKLLFLQESPIIDV